MSFVHYLTNNGVSKPTYPQLQHALLSVTHKINGFKLLKQVKKLFINLKKAFDSVSYQTLMHNLAIPFTQKPYSLMDLQQTGHSV